MENNITEIEYKRLKELRKISVLKEISFNKWRKKEIIDFLEHYQLYFHNNKNIDRMLDFEEFLKFGEYKKYYSNDIEEIKKI